LSGTGLEADSGGVVLRGVREGSGPPIVLAHGLTAHRDLVVHGSRALARAGHELIRYDARGHGESDPGPAGSYVYDRLADDLDAVVAASGAERPVLAGNSMGAHTVVSLALRDPGRWGAVVLIGPASVGVPLGGESLANWDRLAEGLERDGVDGFIAAYEVGMVHPRLDQIRGIPPEATTQFYDLSGVWHAPPHAKPADLDSSPPDFFRELTRIDQGYDLYPEQSAIQAREHLIQHHFRAAGMKAGGNYG